MKLENNVTLITGAGQGIGEAYAQRFVKEGAKVAVADINREKGEAVAAALRKTGGDAIFVPVDVSSEDDTREDGAGGGRQVGPDRHPDRQRRDLLRHRQLEPLATPTCGRSST